MIIRELHFLMLSLFYFIGGGSWKYYTIGRNPRRIENKMNCQVHHLPELETATSGTREALQAIIHTILFIRSPGPVAPDDVNCESFQMTYTRIANDAVSPPPEYQ